MKVVNKSFKVGERYRGLINGRVFTVVEVKQAGQYTTPSGGVYTLRFQTIVFKDESSGKRIEHSIMWAQYLLLERIGEDKE